MGVIGNLFYSLNLPRDCSPMVLFEDFFYSVIMILFVIWQLFGTFLWIILVIFVVFPSTNPKLLCDTVARTFYVPVGRFFPTKEEIEFSRLRWFLQRGYSFEFLPNLLGDTFAALFIEKESPMPDFMSRYKHQWDGWYTGFFTSEQLHQIKKTANVTCFIISK